MPRKGFTPEQFIDRLQTAEDELSQGKAVSQKHKEDFYLARRMELKSVATLFASHLTSEEASSWPVSVAVERQGATVEVEITGSVKSMLWRCCHE
jgi:LEA14-like dessication related protein